MNSREQIFAIARDLKWIAAISVFITALLYFPDQVNELYRLSAAQGNWVLAIELISLACISVALWFGVLLIAAESAEVVGRDKLLPRPARFLRYVPVALSVLPLVGAIAAQLTSMPSTDKWTPEEAVDLLQVGSIFRIEEKSLLDDVSILWVCFFGLIGIALVFILLALYFGKRLAPYLVKANENYFRDPRFIAASVAIIAAVTAVFIFWPDKPAQLLGTFGVVAVFSLCVTAFCVHISLLTIRRKFPFFPIIFSFALLFAALDINDNHYIRTFEEPQDFRLSAGQAFVKWISQPSRMTHRASEGGSDDSYPVFIVTA
jgi:hypothetical protein